MRLLLLLFLCASGCARCSARTLHGSTSKRSLRFTAVRFHRQKFQIVRDFVEAMCAMTFINSVKANAPSGGDEPDDEEDHVDGEDDPVEHIKTARVLRGRARPRDLSKAAKYKNSDPRAAIILLAQVVETISGALDGTIESVGNRLADFVAPSTRPAATLGWFRVRTPEPPSVPRCFRVRLILRPRSRLSQRSITGDNGPNTGQPGMAQILVHMGLFTGAAAKYELDPLPRDSDAALLTEKLVKDTSCFQVGDVSKLGLLLFGDVPITRIIKDNWVPCYRNIASSLRSVLYESVRM